MRKMSDNFLVIIIIDCKRYPSTYVVKYKVDVSFVATFIIWKIFTKLESQFFKLSKHSLV